MRIPSFCVSWVLIGGAIVLLAGGARRLAAGDLPPSEGLAAALRTVRAVQHEGAGNEAARAAWPVLGRVDADHMIDVLAGMDGAGPLATNYLRAAVDTIAERTLANGDSLPTDQLERFVGERRHSPRPRRLAYEWLVRVDPTAPDRLLPRMLDDPGLELRRDAVAQVLDVAGHATGGAAQRHYEVALNAARDLDQVKAAADALAKFGVTTDLATHLGYVVDWHLIGPFDNRGERGFQVPYGPEEHVDFDAVHDGQAGPVSWQRHHTADPNGVVDLNEAIAKHKGAVVYAAAVFVSTEDRPAKLRFGCINACKVWLNGSLVGAHEVYHTAMVPDQYVSTVRLKSGHNTILVKVCQNEQDESWAQRWEFQLRVTDRLGGALRSAPQPVGSTGAYHPRLTPHGSAVARRWVVVAGTMVGAALGASTDWPQFRGPDARGVANGRLLPTDWSSGENGGAKNIAWKVPLPGRGPSSPIVVAGCVVVTCSSGAKQDRLHVLCIDAATGQRLWHRQFWATGRTLCHPTSANAAPTPSSDGARIFAFYSSNDLVCLDLHGNLQWYRGLAFDYPHAGNDAGMASSPLVVGKTVVAQVENQGDSFAVGIDIETGRNRWRLVRRRDASWASPTPLIVPDTQGTCALLQSPSGLTALDPTSGTPVWQLDATCEGIPSPVAADGVVYVAADGITAVKPPREVGQTKPEILWQQNQLKPGSASPIVHRGSVYIISSSGVLSCGDASTGKIAWRQRLKGRFWATPVAIGDRLYAFNSDGLAHVVRLGRKGDLVGTSDLGETIQASPAVVDGAMFVRSDRHLWKLAMDPPSAQSETRTRESE